MWKIVNTIIVKETAFQKGLKRANFNDFDIYSNDTYFDFSLFLKTLIHFPRVNKEALIFPASLSLSPSLCVFMLRSEPARSHKDNLNQPPPKKVTVKFFKMLQNNYRLNSFQLTH